MTNSPPSPDGRTEGTRGAGEALRPRLPGLSGWQPIKTAPRDGRLIIIADFKEDDPSEQDLGVFRFSEGRWFDGFSPDWRWQGRYIPTHWMPIQPPPES